MQHAGASSAEDPSTKSGSQLSIVVGKHKYPITAGALVLLLGGGVSMSKLPEQLTGLLTIGESMQRLEVATSQRVEILEARLEAAEKRLDHEHEVNLIQARNQLLGCRLLTEVARKVLRQPTLPNDCKEPDTR